MAFYKITWNEYMTILFNIFFFIFTFYFIRGKECLVCYKHFCFWYSYSYKTKISEFKTSSEGNTVEKINTNSLNKCKRIFSVQYLLVLRCYTTATRNGRTEVLLMWRLTYQIFLTMKISDPLRDTKWNYKSHGSSDVERHCV